MKKSLYTPIMSLSNSERQDLIRFAKKWCAACFGVNRRHGKDLSVRCISPDEDDFDDMYYGWYDHTKNRMFLNVNAGRSYHIKQFLKTFLHEYTHSLQPVKTRYASYSRLFGYHDNPQEVAARANEIFYRHVWYAYKKHHGM
jgi:hypothetical protein